MQNEPIKLGPSSYVCPYCPKTSVRRQDISKHILTHTGEQPFECPYCSKRFARKDNRDSHIRRNICTTTTYLDNTESFKCSVGLECDLISAINDSDIFHC